MEHAAPALWGGRRLFKAVLGEQDGEEEAVKQRGVAILSNTSWSWTLQEESKCHPAA